MRARLARSVRGWSVALLAGVLSAALHASAGGGFPAPAVVLLAVLLAGLLSTLLVGRTPSLPRLAAAVAGGQLSFHTVFTTLGDTGGIALVPSPHSGHAGHAGHGTLVAEAGAHPSADHSSPGMLLAHVIAGLASALLLAHSERALAAMKGIAVLTLRRLIGAPAPRPLPRLRLTGFVGLPVSCRAAADLGGLRYRGPPALLRAA
jgi:hypothetical protein